MTSRAEGTGGGHPPPGARNSARASGSVQSGARTHALALGTAPDCSVLSRPRHPAALFSPSPGGGATMDPVHEDRYVVYLRVDRGEGERRVCDEEPFASCATYAEARQMRLHLHHAGQECVIRFVGPAGGGD